MGKNVPVNLRLLRGCCKISKTPLGNDSPVFNPSCRFNVRL